MTDELRLLDHTADIITAYVAKNPLPAGELPALIKSVHATLSRPEIGGGSAQVSSDAPKPAVSIRKSITPDHIICLEDGKRFKSLRRHLQTRYNLTPDEYRLKWGLPKDYPMVAPSYSAARSTLAKASGLGAFRASAAVAAKPAGAGTATKAELSKAPPKRRGRPSKV